MAPPALASVSSCSRSSISERRLRRPVSESVRASSRLRSSMWRFSLNIRAIRNVTRKHRDGGKQQRAVVHALEVVVAQQPDRDQAARRRDRGHPPALEAGDRRGAHGLPGGGAHQQGRRGPERVEDPALHIGALGRLEEVDAVAERHEAQAERQQQPAAVRAASPTGRSSPPPGSAEAGPEGIGEVHRDGHGIAHCRVDDRLEGDRPAHAATAEAAIAPSSHWLDRKLFMRPRTKSTSATYVAA